MATTIYMIPCPIAEKEQSSLPEYDLKIVHSIQHFIVERAKTARRFLKEIKHPIAMQDLVIEEMDKHDESYALTVFNEWKNKDIKVGIISEAGCPGIADPGAKIVDAAHRNSINVVPLIGPSSILMALMASGMNGQVFSFHGYLPNKKESLNKKLKELEKSTQRNSSAEIFIETPYRNKALFEDILRICNGSLYLCIAADITGRDEFIKKQKIDSWKKQGFPLAEKKPAIFILGR